MASQRSGADDGTWGERLEAARLARDEGVARIVALKEASELETAGKEGRHVLGRMHGEIDAARRERLLDLLDEEPLAAQFGECPVLDLVARRADDHDLDRRGGGECAMGGREGVTDLASLDECHRAAARADAKEGLGHSGSWSPQRDG